MSVNNKRGQKYGFDLNVTQSNLDVEKKRRDEIERLKDEDDYFYFLYELIDNLTGKKVKMHSNNLNMSTVLDIYKIECDYLPGYKVEDHPMIFKLKDGKEVEVKIPTDLRMKGKTYILDYRKASDDDDEKYISKTFRKNSTEKKMFDLNITLEIID